MTWEQLLISSRRVFIDFLEFLIKTVCLLGIDKILFLLFFLCVCLLFFFLSSTVQVFQYNIKSNSERENSYLDPDIRKKALTLSYYIG